LLVAAALLIPSVRSRPAAPDAPAPASRVPALAAAGRLRVELRRGDAGEPVFHALSPATAGTTLAAPPSWPGEPPGWGAFAGAEAAFLVTVAPDGSVASVARLGAPTAALEIVDFLEALLRESHFVLHSAGDSATVAVFVSVAGLAKEP
jgi:hypothetical protein